MTPDAKGCPSKTLLDGWECSGDRARTRLRNGAHLPRHIRGNQGICARKLGRRGTTLSILMGSTYGQTVAERSNRRAEDAVSGRGIMN